MGEFVSSGDISRYDMNDFTFRRLQRDHINFTETYSLKFGASYISRILINYMSYALENFKEEFEESIINKFKERSKTDYKYDLRISINKRLVDKMQQFNFVDDKLFQKRPTISYILERFAKMRLSDREKVFFYEEYKTIKDTIDKNTIERKVHLIMKTSPENLFEAQPFKLDVDDNSGSFYLVVYSRKKGSNEDFGWYSIKMSKIKKCTQADKYFTLQGEENANAIINKFGIAYMQNNLLKNDMTKTEVRLTEHGYKDLFLRILSYQRPIPISEPIKVLKDEKTYYELTFDCSYYQIKNYFFPFGAEAEIVSPPLVREWFVNDYQKALSLYQSNNE